MKNGLMNKDRNLALTFFTNKHTNINRSSGFVAVGAAVIKSFPFICSLSLEIVQLKLNPKPGS